MLFIYSIFVGLLKCYEKYKVMEFLIVYSIICYIILIYFVSRLASRLNRDIAKWVLLALFFTPLISILGLICLGKEEPITTWRKNLL